MVVGAARARLGLGLGLGFRVKVCNHGFLGVGVSAILADEMGLGKTLQTIAVGGCLACDCLCMSNIIKRFAYLCPHPT